MSNINKFIKNNIILILSIFILSQPIIDLLTSISINFDLLFSFGTIVRFLFMLFLIYYLIFISKCLYRKKSIILISTIFIYLILFILNHLSFFEITNTLRTFYFPIVFICLYNIFKEETIIDNKYILLSLFIYIFIIILAEITNSAFDSYMVAKTGHVGWFNSANEIGAIIALILPILFESIFKKFNIIKLIFLILVVFVSFKVGTRIPLLSLGLCLVIYCFKFVKLLLKKGYKKIVGTTIVSTIIVIIAFILLIPTTPIYKNIIIHTEFLGIDSIDDIFRDTKTIDHFIFSERLSFLSDTNKKYIESDITSKLVGIGYSSNKKMIEMDPFDIFYRHGIVGFMIYFGSIGYVIILNKKKFNYQYLLPVFLTIFISFFAGHVFTAPAVSIFVSIILLKFVIGSDDKMKKKLLFCSYDLNVGGIENALINLLNKIDLTKYDVTLLLEKKQGVFLDRVPEDIKVIEYRVSESKNIILRKLINLCKQIKWILFNYKSYDFSCCYATYSLPCNLISRLSSKNSVLYIHSNYKYVYNKDINKIKEFFDSRSLDKFRKIIFVSNESKNDLCEIYPNIKNKSMVINNFVDSKKILELSKEKIDVKKPKDKKVFMFVGRFEEESKKLTRLLNVFIELNKKHSNLELWMIGNGKDYELVLKFIKENKLEKRVKLYGEQKNPYQYMNMADYIILTSDYEGFPVVYNEAIILNKPIISTIDVTDDYISIPNRFGYIISKDEGKMVNEINEILSQEIKLETVDFEKINKEKMIILENIFEEVI
ncbi:MAG: O-antigen ligase family protein [Bacilli bacterium]|nr:O-antigen ligase family protein [Bacilli bacterium]